MNAKSLLTAAAAGLAVYIIARMIWGPDQYGLDRDSEQSRMLAEQDAGLGAW